MDLDSLVAFVAVVVRSGAALLPATLGAIVTEKAGVTNLGVEGVMLFGAMVAYLTAYNLGSPVPGIVAGTLAGGVLCITHAIPVVKGRVSPERQFVLGLILVFLGDALSRLFGAPYVSHQTAALDQRLRLAGLADVPLLGETLFTQRALVYWSYLLAVLVYLVLFKTRLGLHLRAVGEDPATADSMGVRVDAYRFGAIVVGGMLMGFAGGVVSLSITGTLLFGGFEAAQFRLAPSFPGAQYIFGVFPYLAPIVTLPLIARRLNFRQVGAPAALGRPYFREERS